MSERTSCGSSARSSFVQLRKDDRLDALPPRGERLLANAADRQHEAGQRDLAGHRHVRSHGHAAHRRHHRRRHRHAGGWSVFGDRAGGDVDVDVLLAEELGREPELVRLLADVRQRGARGFLHDGAELPGEDHLSVAAREQRGFDEEHVAARFGPRETGRHARPRRAERRLRPEPRGPEILRHLRGVHAGGLRFRPRRRFAATFRRSCRSGARACERQPRACTRRSPVEPPRP